MMSHITVADVQIIGVPYKKIIDISVEQVIGAHAKCVFILEMEEASADATLYYNANIAVKISGGNSNSDFFYGIILNSVKIAEKDYPAYRFEAYSRSYLLDIIPMNATYQQTQKPISALMQQVADGGANIYFGVTDRAVGAWMYQNHETAWQFIKRLASQCGVAVITNTDTMPPVISIGKTGRHQANPIPVIETYKLDGKDVYRSYVPVELGVEMSGGNYVSYVKTFSRGGEVITDYMLSDQAGFSTPVYYNPSTECTMLKGKVTAVDKEKIQVHFDSIDQAQDSASDCWFEYATPYATGGGAYGSGFYFMPEEGDYVRVFIPSADESKAFAFGTISTAQLSDSTMAQWKVPKGQEILFTKQGIRIMCGDNKLYIDMVSGEGIKVWSEKAIVMESQKEIDIEATDAVVMYADHLLELMSSENKIVIENDKIMFNTANILLN